MPARLDDGAPRAHPLARPPPPALATRRSPRAAFIPEIQFPGAATSPRRAPTSENRLPWRPSRSESYAAQKCSPEAAQARRRARRPAPHRQPRAARCPRSMASRSIKVRARTSAGRGGRAPRLSLPCAKA
eukprot:232503-Chlamydomonas_euryale.AAC.4